MPTRPPGNPTLDLTTPGSSGFIDDGVFETLLFQPANAPNFFTFEQVQHNGFEQGYNTDGTPQFNTKPSDLDHSVLLAQVPIVIGDGTNGTVDGLAYRQFLLNINEPSSGSNPFLSLDSLQIWQEEAGNLTGFTPGAGFVGTHTNNLVYNLDAGSDNWVALNSALSNANGQTDIEVLIPDSSFINDGTHRFVYLYSAFGAQPGWEAGGGFESWGLAAPNGPDVPTNAMSISKTASVPGDIVDHVGEVITYSIEVSDVGNTNLTNVLVTDPSVSDLTRGADVVGNNDNVLDPGEIWSYTAHYTVTQADLAAGPEGGGVITNVATASSDQTSSVSATNNVFVTPASPHTTVGITGTVADGSADAAGDVINYAITITNDSPINLTDPLVSERTGVPTQGVLDGGGFNVGDVNQDGILNPGETWKFTDSYTLTQADLDNRDLGGVPTVDPNLVHSLTVMGLYDQGGPDFATATNPIVQNPHVTLTKTASLATVDQAGEVIHYTIALANDGNMDLTNATVSDPSVSDLAPVMAGGFNAGDTNQDGELSVGETWQYTADHTVTQTEIDNGGTVDPGLAVSNTASATTDQGASATASATVPIVQSPSLTLAKAGTLIDTNGDGVTDAGDTISYTFTETNTGNMTLHGVKVSDTDPGVTVSGSPIASLAPSASDATTFTATYTITQDDMNAGSKDNTATATSDNTSGSATAHVVLPQNVHMSLSETASAPNNPVAGDSLLYTFSLTNDGNVSLDHLAVSDTASDGPITLDQNGPNIVGDANHNSLLDPGETWTFSGSRTLTDADIANGVADASTASALGPQSQPGSATAAFTFHT